MKRFGIYSLLEENGDFWYTIRKNYVLEINKYG